MVGKKKALFSFEEQENEEDSENEQKTEDQMILASSIPKADV